MTRPALTQLAARISTVAAAAPSGRVVALSDATVTVAGLAATAALGDRVELRGRRGHRIWGEVLRIDGGMCEVMPAGPAAGLSMGDRVVLYGPAQIAPDASWLGRLVDPWGQPLDGRPLLPGDRPRAIAAPPPPAAERGRLGARIETGIGVFNTLLPVVRGQRLGLFAGSGVGKTSLIGALARNLEADVVVIGLVGERGREVAEVLDRVVGAERLARTVVVAATSDQSALDRRRCALSAMAVAEHFRDAGQQVLLIVDSITRFVEAHRDVAIAAGQPLGGSGYPPSTAQAIMSLAERAGPGPADVGDITAVFSVLVAGSDMEGPVADILRGVLDGHVVLDRQIAERGRYPAINLLQSVSRSLPWAASEPENDLITETRRLLGAYDRAELMIRSGLYENGGDPLIDRAIRCWPALDGFLGDMAPRTVEESFLRLSQCLGRPPIPTSEPVVPADQPE